MQLAAFVGAFFKCVLGATVDTERRQCRFVLLTAYCTLNRFTYEMCAASDRGDCVDMFESGVIVWVLKRVDLVNFVATKKTVVVELYWVVNAFL